MVAPRPVSAAALGIALLLLPLAVAAGACSKSAGEQDVAANTTRAPQLVTRTGLAMGSQLRITLLATDPASAESGLDAAFAEFDRLDARLSIWKPGSDVLKVNAAAGDHAVVVGADLIDALRTARQVSEWTDGAFDVTFGPLADIWKFDHDLDFSIPTAEALARRRPLVDYRKIEVDEARRTVFLSRPGMRMHLGGIGKGYAVERAALVLRERGFRDFLIQSGGDLYVGGMRRGQPWRLGIADPRHASDVFGTLDLSDATLSTSGDYERAFVKDGVRYHHLLDPATGQPARGCRSVSIVSSSPLLADALSTGVFILGATKGMELVERLPHVEAVIVTDRNDVLVSSGLHGKFRRTRRPSDGV